MALAVATSASAALPTAPCSDAPSFGCATVTVPLDRTGQLPGTIGLSIRVRPASPGPATTALVPLAGGPGQAATPIAADFDQIFGTDLANRDLLIFDQRGTGRSGALHCRSLGTNASPTEQAARCAQELGAARGKYTTQDSVDDLEAIRQASGYDKLTLYGVSYGTKVAELYAARFPEHVDRLILDSVVGPEGPDPLQRSSFAAVPRALSALCAGQSCSGITSSPGGDVARLVKRFERSSLRATFVDSSGARHGVTMSQLTLLNTLNAGDLNPVLRAETPGAVAAALRGDGAPLARLRVRAAGITAQVADESIDETLFDDTVCEELPFPWNRAADPQTRLRQAQAAVQALPASAFAPFDRTTALNGGLIELCIGWPVASPTPPGAVTLPTAIPTLVLEGEQDLRTPVEDARAIAQRLGNAPVIVVPFVGHSVLGSDFTPCAQTAVDAFLAGGTPHACTTSRRIIDPTRIPPLSLGSLRRSGGESGTAGRTLTAIGLSIGDARASLLSALASGSNAPRHLGGLRGGTLTFLSNGVNFSGYSYIPGVTMTGTLRTGSVTTIHVRIGGSAAAHGTVTLRGRSVTGTLGGHRISTSFASSAAFTPLALRAAPYPGLARIR